MNSDRLAQIASDPDFCAFVAETERQLTQKVMAAATPEADRANALAEFHALQRIKGRLASVAYDAQSKD